MRIPRVPRIHGTTTPTIVGIDVETACPTHGAVCSIGVAVVSAGGVICERHWLVDPGTHFDPRFITIHGITPAMVAGAPRLRSIWTELLAAVDEAVEGARPPSLFPIDADERAPLFVAHNAQFDRRQIEAALGTPLPFRLACTVAMSRRAFPKLGRHNLATVSAHLRIPLQHHDALSDARACALIAHRCIATGSGA
jgi:DNA polymerase-3 subunit epsilon